MDKNTAIHFREMMVRNIQEADKVLKILSKKHDTKDDFQYKFREEHS